MNDIEEVVNRFVGKVCCHCEKPAEIFDRVHLCLSCHEFFVIENKKFVLDSGLVVLQ